MSIFREIPPTAGFPIYLKDLYSAALNRRQGYLLDEDFKAYLNVGYARLTYSGTAAFYIILETLKQLSKKKTVVISSFVCPLIPLAIARAGLKVQVCDIVKGSFNFDLKQLNEICSGNSDILAVVAVHLGGVPVDFDALRKVTDNKEIFIVEDCAQSLGALYKDKKVGTLGDFSFFSLSRGKGLTIYEGGVIVSNNMQFESLLNSMADFFIKDDYPSEMLKIIELLGYWVFYRPFLFWFAFRLPQIFWQCRNMPIRAAGEYFDLNFSLHKVSGIRKSLGHAVFSRLEDEISGQRDRAMAYIEKLRGVAGVTLITQPPETRSTYPYLTVVFESSQKRNNALSMFEHSGLGVSLVYLAAITDYDYLKKIVPYVNSTNARYLAQRQLTLSTSCYLTDKDLDRVVNIIKSL